MEQLSWRHPDPRGGGVTACNGAAVALRAGECGGAIPSRPGLRERSAVTTATSADNRRGCSLSDYRVDVSDVAGVILSRSWLPRGTVGKPGRPRYGLVPPHRFYASQVVFSFTMTTASRVVWYRTGNGTRLLGAAGRLQLQDIVAGRPVVGWKGD
jgi:hypothetical protein